jgi:hypothetical protein
LTHGITATAARFFVTQPSVGLLIRKCREFHSERVRGVLAAFRPRPWGVLPDFSCQRSTRLRRSGSRFPSTAPTCPRLERVALSGATALNELIEGQGAAQPRAGRALAGGRHTRPGKKQLGKVLLDTAEVDRLAD